MLLSSSCKLLTNMCCVPVYCANTRHTTLFLLQPTKTNDADEKKLCVLQELYETEKSFLNVLELISQHFYTALCDNINQDDNDLLFSTAKVLISMPFFSSPKGRLYFHHGFIWW